MIDEQARDRLLEAVDKHVDQAFQKQSSVEPRFLISLGDDSVMDRVELCDWLMRELAVRHPSLRFNVSVPNQFNTLVVDFETL
ncbi:hypothetical protein [Pseudomonas sp. CFBP 8772]|uniref:hypothetical protein n=1 Tax=Pseudomonas sp. CFBP 8772 TaxID=2775284 RepID=UPI001782B73F|nr:hypothetical protein [Pseudomonas sp. CFBP 8772]MBD8598759.1 hypothetical protein [Pseudomonas sp. CFBP 8772]